MVKTTLKTTCQILLIALILSVMTITCSAYDPDEIEWAPEKSSKLHIDGRLTLDEYRVDVVELPSPVEGNVPVGRYTGDVEPDEPVTPFVVLNLYKDDRLIKSDITLYGETEETNAYTTLDHELKIRATGFPSPTAKEWVYEYYNPWVTISMQKRGIPELTVTVTTDKDSYNSRLYSHFKARIKVENTGDAYAKDIKLNIETGGLTLERGRLTHTLQRLEKGDSYEEEITLSVPVSLEEKEFEIRATARGYDLKEIEYMGNGSKTITITPPPPVLVEKTGIESMYLKDTMLLKLKVSNTGNYPVTSIRVNDSIPDTFMLVGETPLEWTIDGLDVGGEWSRTYRLKPRAPSSEGHLLPAAHAKFTLGGKTYDLESNQPRVIVRGPNITLRKSVDKTIINPGETIRVTITAENIGDLPTRTEVTDKISEKTELVSGELNRTEFLLKDESLTYNYTIRLNTPGEVVILPNVTARFTDVVYRGVVREFTSSEPIVITVIDPDAPIDKIDKGKDRPPTVKNAEAERSEKKERSDGSDGEKTTPRSDKYVQPGFKSVLTVIGILFTHFWHRRSTQR